MDEKREIYKRAIFIHKEYELRLCDAIEAVKCGADKDRKTLCDWYYEKYGSIGMHA